MESKQLFSHLRWIILAVSAFTFLDVLFRINTKAGDLWIIRRILEIALTWGLIYFVTKEKKGAIKGFATMLGAMIFFYVFGKVFQYSYKSNIGVFRYLLNLGLIAFSFYLFAKEAFKTQRKQIIFTTLATIVNIGVSTLCYVQIKTRFLNKLLYNLFGLDLFDFGLFTYKSGDSYIHLDGTVFNGIGNIIFMLVFIALYKNLKCDSLRKIVPFPTLNKLKATVIFGLFYTFIFIYCFAIIDSIRFINPRGADSLYFLRIFLTVVFSITTLCAVCYLYRKLLIEFYLAHGKKISWNYFFLQAPIIGVFIWIYNLITFKNPSTLNLKNKKRIVDYTDNSGIMLLGLFAASLNFLRISNIYDAILIGAFVLLLLAYYVLKYGIYIHLTIYIGLFLLLLYTQYFKLFNTPINVIGFTYFFSIAYLIIQYPVFHLTTFEIETTEEEQ